MPSLFFSKIVKLILATFISLVAISSLLFLPTPPDKSKERITILVDEGRMPAIAPNDGAIAYSVLRNKRGELWLIEKEGRGKRLLVDLTGDILKPKWSPNGSEVAFINVHAFSQIFKISQNGVTTPVSRVFDKIENFEWFDNEWILHDGYENGSWSVWLSNSKNTYIRLTSGELNARWPSFSTNKQYIVFSIRYEGYYKLVLYDLKESKGIKLTDGEGDDIKATFSPDNKKIAYLSNRTGKWSIWIKNIDIENDIELTPSFSENKHPKWSPDVDLNTSLLWTSDSQRIIFDAFRGDSRALFMIDLRGGRVTLRGEVKQYFPLIQTTLIDKGMVYNPTINESGTAIYFENKTSDKCSIIRFDLEAEQKIAYG